MFAAEQIAAPCLVRIRVNIRSGGKLRCLPDPTLVEERARGGVLAVGVLRQVPVALQFTT